MPYGINPASEVCQQQMVEVIDRIPVDDILVYPNSAEEHITTIKKLFSRLREHNLQLNPSKAEVGVKELIFLGFQLSQKGIAPDDSKVQAINDMKSPKNKPDLRRILGTVLFLKDFIPSMSTTLAHSTRCSRKKTASNLTNDVRNHSRMSRKSSRASQY